MFYFLWFAVRKAARGSGAMYPLFFDQNTVKKIFSVSSTAPVFVLQKSDIFSGLSFR